MILYNHDSGRRIVVIIFISIATTVLAAAALIFWNDIVSFKEYFKIGFLKGVDSREAVVTKYIDGLKNQNRSEIDSLLPNISQGFRENNNSEIIENKLKIFNGADFGAIKIRYSQLDFPENQTANIENIRQSDGRVIDETIHLTRDCYITPGILNCKKWFIDLNRL